MKNEKMTEDQQAGTLAFLQNFYTGVTLYMPRETAGVAPVAQVSVAEAEPAASAAAITAAPAVAPVAAVPAPPPVAATVAPATAATGPAPAEPAGPPRPAAPAAIPATPVAPALPAAATPGYLLTQFNTLGNNAQGIVILVRLPDEQFRKLPRNVFLNKLLQAIRLVMADVVLVNVDGPYPVALENLRREIAATQVLAFGKNLLDVAVRTTQIYEPVLFPNLNLSYLAAAEVEMVEYDTSLKKRLWAGLQAMFL